jgi:hypothetical protein
MMLGQVGSRIISLLGVGLLLCPFLLTTEAWVATTKPQWKCARQRLGVPNTLVPQWIMSSTGVPRIHQWRSVGSCKSAAALYSTPSPLSDNESAAADDSTETNASQSVLPQRTTFDQAGKSLMDEQDNQRMEAMGDFDANPDVRVCMESDSAVVVANCSFGLVVNA